MSDEIITDSLAPRQNELTALLDQFDAEVNLATRNEHWLALSLLVTPLVKALRLETAQLQSMKTRGFPEERENQAVTGTLVAVTQLLRELGESKQVN